MNRIEIYTKPTCPYCRGAKYLLAKMELAYEETDISVQQEKRKEMIQRSGRFTVPQIFINDKLVGGHDDLVRLNENGELSVLLNNNKHNMANQSNSTKQGVHHAT